MRSKWTSPCPISLSFSWKILHFISLTLFLRLGVTPIEGMFNLNFNEKVNVRVGEILRDRETGAGGSGGAGGKGEHIFTHTNPLGNPGGGGLVGERNIRGGGISSFDENAMLNYNNHAMNSDISGEYSGVDIQVMGRPIDLTVLKHLQPDLSPKTLQQLRVILGEKFDREWTSEGSPKTIYGQDRSLSSERRGLLDPKLSLEVQSLNLTLIDSSGASYSLPTHLSEMFQSWHLRYASCDMDYIWEDLGPLFWPRWIRRGVCLNSAHRSCSWPPGTKCRASGSRALHILHWKCQLDDATTKQRREKEFEKEKSERMQRRMNKWRPRQKRDRSLNKNAGGQGGGGEEVGSQQPRTLEWKQQRYERKVRRITRRLSLTSNGYHCYWQMQKYLISDRCNCACN